MFLLTPDTWCFSFSGRDCCEKERGLKFLEEILPFEKFLSRIYYSRLKLSLAVMKETISGASVFSLDLKIEPIRELLI